jgi:hypothetical protein
MEKKLCPLMDGYPAHIAICYVPQEIRKLIPNCAQGGQCQVAKLIPAKFAEFCRYHNEGKNVPQQEIKKIKNHLTLFNFSPYH